MLQKIVGIILIFAIIAGVVLLVQTSPKSKTNTAAHSITPSVTSVPNIASLTIDNHTFSLEIAHTEAQKEEGLADRATLPADHGMLFPFSKPDTYNFWMKGMEFPLDIIYLQNNKVVDIFTDNAPAAKGDQNPPRLVPKFAADTVLEINAGLVRKYNIKLGDTVTITY